MTPMQPSKRPKNEPAKVTIANQDRQIEMLCQRIYDLESDRTRAALLADENYESAKAWREQCQKAEKERDHVRALLRERASENDYHRGYIARVKETDRHMFGDPPVLDSVAPGV